jgi:hypothetical protein
MANASEAGPSRVRVAHLTGATIADAPQCCVGCTWWQERLGGRSVDKRRWMDDVQESFGPWGKLYLDGGRLVGLLQYGPASVFARPRDLPAGPPSEDAVLVTCSFLVQPTSPWALQSLFLACIGEVRDGGFAALEAFAYRYEEGEEFAARFLQHRTVFPRDFLADFGFRVLRASGRVELMRLELGGIVPVVETENAVARLWHALRARQRAGMPAPVR